MIAFLRGQLLERHPAHVILDVQGVGYEVHVPVSTFSRLPATGTQVSLHIFTHVREDALQLYGFATPREKALFEKLISVSGIGPRLGLAILSGIPADDLAAAIRGSDLARLTAIPGVGKKTAERVLVELRDKLDGLAPASQATSAGTPADDVVSALVNLGYARPIAEQTVTRALASVRAQSFDEVFKDCMRRLSER